MDKSRGRGLKPSRPYRAVVDGLIHEKDFQELSPFAKLAYLMLRLSLGASGIDVFYPELLGRIAGLPPNEVRIALEELIGCRQLEVEANVMWLRYALEQDPNLFPRSNENHRKFIEKHIQSLPRLRIINRFAQHYGLTPPFPELHVHHSLSDAIRHQ